MNNERMSNEAFDHALFHNEDAAETTSLRSSLNHLRDAADAYVAQQPRRPLLFEAQPSRNHIWQWSLAAVAACALAVVPFVSHHHAGVEPVARVTTQPAQNSDDALFENISDDLASTVPDAMEPLAYHAEGTDTSASLHQD